MLLIYFCYVVTKDRYHFLQNFCHNHIFDHFLFPLQKYLLYYYLLLYVSIGYNFQTSYNLKVLSFYFVQHSVLIIKKDLFFFFYCLQNL
ncbi:hypothetical protein PFDG_04548 [Plasmodium falciparum Dd2]|uniref:Uncharacterized protein n=1 Tax=Plasmodium falciparum (isolate Dd2) TaxID=57267 RepID=A0A0L7M5F2_PLAF4|nr:hypothetical protein PFDG_04548 [Plasmodium falciparum Dd2]